MTNQLFTSKEIAKGFLQSRFDVENTFDVCIKEISIKNLPTLIVYISGLVNGEPLAELLANLQWEYEEEIDDEVDYFHAHFNYHGMDDATSQDDFLLGVLSGRVGFITLSGYAFLAEFREYPGRSPEEPDNEKVIRGSRDGFAENIIQNAALIRRRIRSTELRYQMHKVSTLSQMDVVIAYMDNLVNDQHLNWIIERLEQIQHDGLTMADKSLEEWLFKQRFHPLPFVRYSERPDIVAAHLLEGHIAIIVDTSPSVMLIPVTMFHLLQHAEEYRQAPLIGTTMRILRYIAVLLSFVLLPFWYLLVTNEALLPDQLSYIGVSEKSELPLFLQILIADVGIEYLRIAAIHTPTPLSTAMGLIAGIIIGQIAIDVGLFSSEIVLYTAITAIFTFAIPNYELSISVKVFRILLLAMTALFGINGFFIGIFLIFSYLCTLKPMNVPYLWPFVPFFPKAFLRVLIRFPMSQDALRPYVVGAKQRKRA
ncbi:spore germination protein [Lysinibacillus sp. 2017]|uniref:spore germination protein n=1 Tax=unclassified Lysinibacillus TaxID=2636778 RepID=UPI000D52A4D8|nr:MULTISPECIES: spore germination protein [unclassified Lysinibacillus]AWE06879.1 spore germination protein [Lysinibacillus sp. 2017]TGN37190.1 spore germination protein [Lysinibacillus sp. S2017]